MFTVVAFNIQLQNMLDERMKGKNSVIAVTKIIIIKLDENGKRYSDRGL